MRGNLSFLIFLLVALAAAALPDGALEANAAPPSSRYLTAYESMTTADWLAKREMSEDAALLYDEARKMFQQLATDFPQWQTNLVAFRINYCREEFHKALNPKKTEAARPAAPVIAAPPKTFPAALAPASAASGPQADELEKSGDYQAALELYQAALAVNNQEPRALSGAGRCLLKLGRPNAARDLLLQWSLIPSPDNQVNLLLALCFCREQQFARAIQLAEIVLGENSADAPAHVIMGVALAGTGQTEAAMAEMQKALALEPRLPEAHYNLARLVLKKEPKRKATAQAYYQNALKFGALPDPALEKYLQK